MEIDNLILALEKTISLLQVSNSSFWSSLPIKEVAGCLENELHKARNSQQNNLDQLKYLFGPTGPLQETSIDNGWGEEFLEISKVVDGYIEFN